VRATRRWLAGLLIISAIALGCEATAGATSALDPTPTPGVTAATGPGTVDVSAGVDLGDGWQADQRHDGALRDPAPKVVRKWVGCTAALDPYCLDYQRANCQAPPDPVPGDKNGHAVVLVEIVGERTTSTGQYNCSTIPQPAGPDWGRIAYDELRKRVPAPAVVSTGANTLVNLQTLLWVDTEPDTDLGDFTLAGRRLGLRVHLQKITWNFGDGSTDTTTTPGHKYDPHWSTCDTKLCPDYYGHVYLKRGKVTVTAATTWTGQYQLGTGPWTDITGTATGATTELPITVKQTRVVLVPNPGD